MAKAECLAAGGSAEHCEAVAAAAAAIAQCLAMGKSLDTCKHEAISACTKAGKSKAATQASKSARSPRSVQKGIVRAPRRERKKLPRAMTHERTSSKRVSMRTKPRCYRAKIYSFYLVTHATQPLLC